MQYSPFNHRALMLPVFDPVTGTALALSAAGTAMSAMGTIAGGKAAAQAGYATQQSHEFTARQQEQAAQEGRAVSQRSALEKRREGTLLSSKMLARAAASGGGADDPTVTKIGEDIAGRSEYDALFEMYKGENRARGLLDAAMGSRMTGDAALAEGEAKKKASYLSAAGTIIGGAGSMFGQYSKTLPKTPGYG
jgi:hypothetical protein